MDMNALPIELLGVVLRWVPNSSHALVELVGRTWRDEIRRIRRAAPTRVGPWLYAATVSLYRLHVFSDPPVDELVRRGNVATLRGVNPRTLRCSMLAKYGHVETLQWARANGCPWDTWWGEWTCTQAAINGHLEVIQWARANGGTNGGAWDARTCANAARGGHLETLQWSRANGCAWDARTCADAARGGHLETLQWARANGCPWTSTTCAWAAEKGHFGVLQWARANGCP
jgi:hypothetical protein